MHEFRSAPIPDAPVAADTSTVGLPGSRLLGLLCLALLLSACGGPADTRTHVLLWHQKGSPEREVFEGIVARYNAAHPDRVVEALYHENEELRSLYIVAAVAGEGPDLVYGPSDNVGVYVTTKVIRPLDDALLRPEFAAQFVDDGLVRYQGQTWLAADQIGNHLALVCDRALVPEPPKTLDDLVALGQKLTGKDPVTGQNRYGLTWPYQEPFFFIPFLTAFGGWVMDEKTGRPTLDNEQTIAALQFVIDLRDKYHVIPRDGDYEMTQTLYKERSAAMIINGTWAWPGYGVGEGGRSRIAALPENPALGTRCTSMYCQRGYMVNVNVPAAKVPMVREVLEHFAGPVVQQELADKLFIPPVNKAVRASPSVANSPVQQASFAQIAQARPMPIRPEMRQIWDGMRGPFQLIMSGAVPPREGARMMQRECEKQLADARL